MTKEECLSEINTKYLRKDGKLNSALLRRDNFKKSPLNEFILERTSFLPSTASYTERLHCIEKDFTSVPLCPFSNEPLWFSPNERCYSKCKKEFIQKIQNIPERTKNQRLSHIETIERKKRFLLNSFLSGDYTKMDLLEVKKQIDTLRSNTKENQLIFLNDYILKKDFLCSVISYTDSSLLPLRKDLSFNWAERFYLIKNDMFEPLTCSDDPTKKAKFINTYKGYGKISNRNSGALFHITNVVIPAINKQGFDVVEQDKICRIRDQRFVVKCRKCGVTFDADFRSARWKRIYCFGCFKPIGRSKQEDEIVEFLKQNNIKNITLNNTSILATKEIDILLDDYNTAIELDGLLWHSFGNSYPNNASWEPKYKYKGAKKSIECFRKGIHLMHIYDNEWSHKSSVVQSIILANLKKCSRKIFARKCVIKDLTEEQQQIFFKHNSLFDYQKTFKSFGLFYKNELVSCMSFNINGDKIILTNFVSSLNTTVTGGFSKLLSHIKRSYPSFCIEAKADFRLFSQKTLKLAGFVLKSLHKPKRFTTDGHHLYEEGENAPKKQRNFYDCGHGIFVLQP
jgi:hypothetical protein